ncbi:hypothetical protein ACU4GD_01915 [Cupriavidus basilensis]
MAEPARYQSLWLLAAVCSWPRATAPPACQRCSCRTRFPDAANIRMLVSRASCRFRALGHPGGLGPDRSQGAAGLNPAHRSRGPFWITPAACKRLRFTVDGRRAGDAALARFVGPATGAARRAGKGRWKSRQPR